METSDMARFQFPAVSERSLLLKRFSCHRRPLIIPETQLPDKWHWIFFLQTPVFTFWGLGTKASRVCNERSAALLISDRQWRPITNNWLLAGSTAYGRLSAVLAIPCWAGAVSWHYPGLHGFWAKTDRGALASGGYFKSRQQPCAVNIGHEWSGRHDDVYVWWDRHTLRWFQWGNSGRWGGGW